MGLRKIPITNNPSIHCQMCYRRWNNLNSIQINEIGELIRKRRREQGLRLEDLADENISPATISNIERGVPYVHQEKVRYVLSKLRLNPEDLPKLLLGEQQSMERL